MKQFFLGLIPSVVLLLGYICYTTFYVTPRDEKEKAYWRAKAFKTDTVFTEKFNYSTRVLDAEKLEEVPPAIVNYYGLNEKDANRLMGKVDSLLSVVDTLNNKKTDINPIYLTTVPRAHKLLSLNSSLDTLSLDLLGIDGKIRTEVYPTNYSQFKYSYINNTMRATELSARKQLALPKLKFFRYDGVYVNYEENLLRANRVLDATLSVDVWRLRLGGFARYNLQGQNPNQINAGFRIGAKLF